MFKIRIFNDERYMLSATEGARVEYRDIVLRSAVEAEYYYRMILASGLEL